MTGLDRLREIAEDVGRTVWLRDLGAALSETADAIEGGARGLRGYERDAIAWVREHGGLDSVKKLLDWVVGHCSTRQQLDFDFWLSGRVMYELGFEEDMADRDEVERRLLARLMPEGMSWPVFEDGEPVRIGDVVSDVEVRSVVFRDGGILLSDCTSVPGWGTWRSYKEPIKRPAPKVLDADGVEIHEGDKVYLLPGDWCDKFPCFGYYGGEELEVFSLHADHVEGGVGCRDTREPKGTCCPQPSQLTHRAPVIAADGKPLEVGQAVWHRGGNAHGVVESIDASSLMHTVRYRSDDGEEYRDAAKDLTHERPDSFSLIEHDSELTPYDYSMKYGKPDGVSNGKFQRVHLVRRCRALAERVE